jgi:hypothetical protein
LKSSVAIAACLAATICLAAPAFAVDIENEDETTYEVSTVGGNAELTNFELAPGAREADVCTGRCTVMVEGIGKVEADQDEIVIIESGRLLKEPKDR